MSQTVIKSKIKQIFREETLELLAKICDARRFPSNVEKMKMCCQILKMHGYNFMLLGGATNRLTIQIDGYAVKLAIDSQGYKDNLVEYAICPELYNFSPKHPVSKTYESSGYMLIAECVRLMTEEEWIERGSEILKILDDFSNDYLLGDVGYLKKNRTNWGVADDGRLVILDYAYVHRATEDLFVCERCGDGILSYDDKYDILLCSNRTGCHARYTYSERKRIQGDQVDLDMIEERKERSIALHRGEYEKNVQSLDAETFIDGDIRVIHNRTELLSYLSMQEEKRRMAVRVNYDGSFDDLIDLLQEKESNPEEANKKIKSMLSGSASTVNAPNGAGYILADDYVDEIPGFTARKLDTIPEEYRDFMNDFEDQTKLFRANENNSSIPTELNQNFDDLIDRLEAIEEPAPVKAQTVPGTVPERVSDETLSTDEPEKKSLIINGKAVN